MNVAPALLLGAFILSLAGCFVLPEEEKILGPPVMKPPEVKYDVIELSRKDIARQIYLFGHLVPVLDKELFFRYQGGRLTHIYAKIGDEVKKGDVLAELNLGNLLNQLEQKKIIVEKTEIQYEMRKALSANKFELRLVELDMKLAELQLLDLQVRIEGARLTSPINGTVVNIGAKEGEYIAAFQPVIRVVDPSNLILRCQGGKDADYFYTGMNVDVIIHNTTRRGKIIKSPRDSFWESTSQSDEDKDTILIKVEHIPENASMSDMGRIILTLESRENVLVLPKNVIHHYAGRTYVNIFEQDLKQEKYVEIGIQTSSEVEIVKGLNEGDLVIID